MLRSSIDAAERALRYVPADLSYNDWIMVAMGIKNAFGEDGFCLFDHWSRDGKRYCPTATKRAWRGIRGEGGVTIATLFYLAKQHGYTNDTNNECLIDVARFKPSRQCCSFDSEAEYIRHIRVANNCNSRWRQSASCRPDHPYVVAKRIKPVGVRQRGLAILLPLIDIESVLWNVQYIMPDASKRFAKGGRLKGLFCPLGKASGDEVNVCEGWATGVTVHQFTGQFVACAMTAGNLKTVALKLREKYPSKHIRIIADNDRFTAGNPGLTKAEEAASAVNGSICIPEFMEDEKGTDWNDYAIARNML